VQLRGNLDFALYQKSILVADQHYRRTAVLDDVFA
jgi:hypothetical protein